MRLWLCAASMLLALGLITITLSSPTHAAPAYQAPTAEPTKPPYVFPTPIFIPTYPGDAAPATVAPVRNSPQVQRTPSRGERAYTVVQGDNPWVISQKVYGSGSKYKYILEGNGLNESSVLRVGMVLRIPGVDASGNPLPIAAPSIAPTEAPPIDDVSSLSATPQITDTTPVTVSTKPTPKSTTGGSTMAETVINLVVLLLLLGSAVCGAFAYVYYRRSERTKKLDTLAKRIRSTK